MIPEQRKQQTERLQCAVATGLVVAIQLGVDDLKFGALANGGDELFEDLRFDEGVDACRLKGDA